MKKITYTVKKTHTVDVEEEISITYKDVIKEYEEQKSNICLSEEYLEEHNSEFTRKNLPLVGEYEYGIAYLRDDAVELLIDRIRELENGN